MIIPKFIVYFINILAIFLLTWMGPKIFVLHLRCIIHDRGYTMGIWDIFLALSITWLLISHLF